MQQAQYTYQLVATGFSYQYQLFITKQDQQIHLFVQKWDRWFKTATTFKDFQYPVKIQCQRTNNNIKLHSNLFKQTQWYVNCFMYLLQNINISCISIVSKY